jgi:hypothetical protein
MTVFRNGRELLIAAGSDTSVRQALFDTITVDPIAGSEIEIHPRASLNVISPATSDKMEHFSIGIRLEPGTSAAIGPTCLLLTSTELTNLSIVGIELPSKGGLGWSSKDVVPFAGKIYNGQTRAARYGLRLCRVSDLPDAFFLGLPPVRIGEHSASSPSYEPAPIAFRRLKQGIYVVAIQQNGIDRA